MPLLSHEWMDRSQVRPILARPLPVSPVTRLGPGTKDRTSLVFIPIFKYLVSSVIHGNLLCRHLQIIFISTAVILPKLYDVYIVHNIELQC